MSIDKERFRKVPEVTFGFSIIKSAANTLGETRGDAVIMSMNLGDLLAGGGMALSCYVASAILAALILACIALG